MATTVRPETTRFQRTAGSEQRPGKPPIRLTLQQRALGAYRRHLLRGVIRVSALVVADLLAYLSLRVTVLMLIERGAGSSALQLFVPAGSVVGWQFAAALLVGLGASGAYRQGDWRRDSGRLLTGVVIASTLVLWDSLWVSSVGHVLLQMVVTANLAWAAVITDRWLVDRAVSRFLPRHHRSEHTLFIGNPGETAASKLYDRLISDKRIHPLGWVCPRSVVGNAKWLGEVAELSEILNCTDVDTVVVCETFEDERFEEIVEAATLAGCRVLSISRLDRLGRVHPTLVWHRGVPLVQLSVPTLKAQQFLLKRIIDIVGASLGLVLLAPVFVLIAGAIRLDSPGSVFFSHERVGLGGRVFRMLKFRTMRNGADNEKKKYAHLNHTGDPRLFKIPNDPRVTRVGAWLRRWSLDELPQLCNVLGGQMSLVGPRPFFESDLAEYSEHHFVRLSAKPGITGLWQVRGRSSVIDFEEVVRLDREYIDRWSLWLDLRILSQTLPAVVRRTGAY